MREKVNYSSHSTRQSGFPIITDINSLYFTVECFSWMDVLTGFYILQFLCVCVYIPERYRPVQ